MKKKYELGAIKKEFGHITKIEQAIKDVDIEVTLLKNMHSARMNTFA